MRGLVERNLRRRYPGWLVKAEFRGKGGGYRADFVLEKMASGRVKRIVVEVKLKCYITDRDVRQLTGYVRRLAGGSSSVVGAVLVVPSGVRFSREAVRRIARRYVEVMRLRKCRCEPH